VGTMRKVSTGRSNCQDIFIRSTVRMNENAASDGWGRVYGGALREVAEEFRARSLGQLQSDHWMSSAYRQADMISCAELDQGRSATDVAMSDDSSSTRQARFAAKSCGVLYGLPSRSRHTSLLSRSGCARQAGTYRRAGAP
jgi:hypothetical protein